MLAFLTLFLTVYGGLNRYAWLRLREAALLPAAAEWPTLGLFIAASEQPDWGDRFDGQVGGARVPVEAAGIGAAHTGRYNDGNP